MYQREKKEKGMYQREKKEKGMYQRERRLRRKRHKVV